MHRGAHRWGIQPLAALLAASILFGACTGDTDADEEPELGELAALAPQVANPLAVACRIGVCVADQVVLPARRFVDSAVDLTQPDPFALLSIERLWVGTTDAEESDEPAPGVFGAGWWTWFELRVDDGELVGPAPALPVSRVRGDGAIDFADGSRVSFDDGIVTGACPAQGWCVEVTRTDQEVLLTAAGPDRNVRLELADGRVGRAVSSDGRNVEYRYADGRLAEANSEHETRSYGYDGSDLTTSTDRLGTRTVSYREGLVTSITDRDGDVWSFDPQAAGAATTNVVVTRASGSTLTYAFTERWLTRVTDNEGEVLLQRLLDEAGNLRSEALPGDALVTTWLADGTIDVRRDRPEGGADEVVRYEVDPLGRVTKSSGADGTLSYSYRGTTPVVTSVSRDGGRTSLSYDDRGLLASVRDPDSYEISITRDERGLPIVVGDGTRVRQLSYDELGRIVEERAGETATGYTYDAHGNLTVEASGDREQRYEYDERGRLVEISDISGTETLVYDDLGRLVEAASSRDQTLTYGDPQNPQSTQSKPRLVQSDESIADVDAAGGTFSDDAGNLVGFDAAGRMVAIETAAGASTRTYDASGQLIGLTLPDGRSFEVERSPAGRPREIIDGLGRRTELTWAGDRLTRLVSSTGAELRYEWNVAGLLEAAHVGPLSWTYSYDDYGNPTRVETPHGDVTFEWDAAGKPLRTVGPNGAVTSYEWQQELLRRIVAGGEELIALEWDDSDRLLTVESPESDQSFEYDDAGRVIRHESDNGDRDYVYNEDGRVVEVHQGSRTEQWTWSGDQVTEVRTGDDEDDVYQLRWAAPGQLERIDHAGETFVQVVFDRSGSPAGVQARDDDEWIDLARFSLSPDGQLTDATIDDATVSVAFDDDGRVVSMSDREHTHAAEYVEGAAAELSAGGVTLTFGYEDGLLTTSSFAQDDERAELTWADGDEPTSFATSQGDGELRYADDGRVATIVYDDEQRPVEYDADGEPDSDGTGGELLGDLFDGAGHFDVLPSAATAEPVLPYIAALPEELGVSLPTITEPADYVDSFLAATMPVTPGLLIDNGHPEDVARRQADLVLAGASVSLATGPATSESSTFGLSDPESVETLLDGTPTAVSAASLLDRLSPDRSILERITGAGGTALRAITTPVTWTWRFLRDNPVAGALLTVTFIALGTVTGVGLVEFAIGLAFRVEPGNTLGSLTANILGPIQAVVQLVRGPSLANLLVVADSVLAVAPFVKSSWARYGCQLSRVVCVSRARFGEAATHIDEAIAEGHTRFLATDYPGAATRRRDAQRGIARVTGFDLDEYPPAFTAQGGTGASIRAIDPSANRAAGAFIRGQLPDVNGYRFLVQVVA